MNNILRIFRSDIKRVFSNVINTIIAVGLIVMPSIFAWYNVLACWDVFNNTGNLKVAVANADDGYESDLFPIRINVGDQVISALRANDQIDWVFTDAEDAVDGAKAGRYYAAVVIPEDFSRDMLTFYSNDVEHARVIYYANEKKNAIAPKITGQGADTVSYQVNQVFAQKLSEISLVLASSIVRYMDESGFDGSLVVLSDHIKNMSSKARDTADVVGLYADLMRSASGLAADTSGIVDAARQEASNISEIASSGVSSLKGYADTLTGSVNSISETLESGTQSIDEIERALDAIFAEASSGEVAAAAKMRTQADALDARAGEYAELARKLEGLQTTISGADVSGVISALDAISRQMKSASQELRDAAGKLDEGNASVQAHRESVKASLGKAKSDFEELKKSFSDGVGASANRISDHSYELAQSLDGKLGSLFSGASDLSSTVSKVGSELSGNSNSLTEMKAKLEEAAQKLDDLASRLDIAIAQEDPEAIKQILTGDVQSLARALAAPVSIEREAVFPADNFGSAMTPLYSTLALFIGSLLILVVVKPKLCRAEMKELVDPKPHQLFLGRFGMMALISLLQTSLMGLGNLLFLQVQAADPLLFMICYWTAGLVFTFIIYALVAAFANLGKAVAVLLLIVQVTGCGGSFPLQIMPWFVQALSPWLPATYVVNAMRAAMFGVCNNDFWISIGMLLLFLIPAAIIGLVLRKPFSKFMNWYLGKVEESKLL